MTNRCGATAGHSGENEVESVAGSLLPKQAARR